jgi:hypothetical protein
MRRPSGESDVTELAASLADLALDTARAAAELVRGRAAQGVTVADTKSSDVDVVTEADRAAEALIRDRIRAARPDDAFVGEEEAAEPGTTGVRWIIDPIDGTVNFLYGLPQYAVSIAAEVDGEVVAGVVIDVAKDIEYVARPGTEGVVALRSRSAWSGRGSPTGRRCVRSRPGRWPGCCPGSATSVGSVPARSTSAPWPRGHSTATSRRASTSGTTPPPASSREQRAPPSRPSAERPVPPSSCVARLTVSRSSWPR